MEEQFVVNENLRTAVLNYLQSKPFNQVYQNLKALEELFKKESLTKEEIQSVIQYLSQFPYREVKEIIFSFEKEELVTPKGKVSDDAPKEKAPLTVSSDEDYEEVVVTGESKEG